MGLISGRFEVTKATLHLEAPDSSILSDWPTTMIHLTDQNFLESRFAELPPGDASLFSYAVRRGRGQLVVEERCDEEVSGQ